MPGENTRKAERSVRVTREWHGGLTLVVFHDAGMNQLAITVCGPKLANEGEARDAVTGRAVERSICFGGEDLDALEDAIAQMRAWQREIAKR